MQKFQWSRRGFSLRVSWSSVKVMGGGWFMCGGGLVGGGGFMCGGEDGDKTIDVWWRVDE
ncbi:transmembrane protein, putative [Medicago truncatula]|uniref:Transmembrane protein, putative n=1 Tax=Medicago truncatula TaxID=3880 RepID=G7IXM2_MEDTR|nr:transmembrane protein, putative [Medicago truncatula]